MNSRYLDLTYLEVKIWSLPKYENLTTGKTRNVSTVKECPRPTPSPTQVHDPGQRDHTLNGLDVGKCHTKFQLSSPEGIKVISCKIDADVKLHLNLQVNLQVNLNLVMNVTYAHTHICT